MASIPSGFFIGSWQQAHMRRLITCIPNFSEGRSRTVVAAFVNAVESVPGVYVLDHTMDQDHHRSVLTFVGEPDAVQEAAFRAIRTATDLIDLRRHEGVHPRVGATDVVPFVPIRGATMDDCVQSARQLGLRVGQELRIPVFLYERAATRPEHRPLEVIRQGGLEGLAFRMGSDPHWLPDFGPPHPHATAGAIVIGARPPLIAFNVNLRSRNVAVARAIAKAIRQSNGGAPHLKAIGVELASRGMVQVAMNLTDYRVTPLHAAFEAVQTQASLRGVPIAGSEVIGLVPEDALAGVATDALRLEKFDTAQILEAKIDAALLSAKQSAAGEPSRRPEGWPHLTVAQLIEAVAAPSPFPAGASVTALVGALAASLGVMAARLSRQRAGERLLSKVVARLRDLAPADGAAYQRYIEAVRLPKSDPRRPSALSAALHVATEIPLEIAEQSVEAGTSLHAAAKHVKPTVHADAIVALFLAVAAGEASLYIVRENLKRQSNQQLKHAIHSRIEQVSIRLEELRTLCYTPPPVLLAVDGPPIQARPEKARKRSEWKSKSSITTSKKRSKLRRKNSRAKGSSGN
jgi:glutamate formiminotransferase/glutamate formiminotransferase/formiminotetrahydrofolate cyclodeaminase